MKKVYPVVFKMSEGGYAVWVPDMDISTQGADLAEAIEMARDAIGLMGIDMQDDKKAIPEPTSVDAIKPTAKEMVSMVDVDFDAYRRANERRIVRRNVSLPSWLNDAAEQAGLNVSAVLQAAIKKELNI